MAGAPTFQELYDIAKAEALARRATLALNPGDVSDFVIGAIAAAGDRVVGYTADRFKATYVDGAQVDDLTTLANDHWSIVRFAAVAAIVVLEFDRIGSTGVFTIPAGTRVATVKDAQGNSVVFTTDAPLSWANGVSGFKLVAATAQVAGVGGNVAVGTLTQILDSLTETATVTNAIAATGGSDEETDKELRERIRQFPSTIRRATLSALEYGALQVPLCRRATASEDVTGIVTVYVSDVNGNSTGVTTPVDVNTVDAGTLTSKVAVELFNWAAAGAVVNVTGGVLESVDVQYHLTVRSGFDPTPILTTIAAAITNRMLQLKIGETLYSAALVAAICNVDARIVNATVAVRTGSNPYLSQDIVPAANEVIRAGAIAAV